MLKSIIQNDNSNGWIAINGSGNCRKSIRANCDLRIRQSSLMLHRFVGFPLMTAISAQRNEWQHIVRERPLGNPSNHRALARSTCDNISHRDHWAINGSNTNASVKSRIAGANHPAIHLRCNTSCRRKPFWKNMFVVAHDRTTVLPSIRVRMGVNIFIGRPVTVD